MQQFRCGIGKGRRHENAALIQPAGRQVAEFGKLAGKKSAAGFDLRDGIEALHALEFLLVRRPHHAQDFKAVLARHLDIVECRKEEHFVPACHQLTTETQVGMDIAIGAGRKEDGLDFFRRTPAKIFHLVMLSRLPPPAGG
jgi:hypothetical protein